MLAEGSLIEFPFAGEDVFLDAFRDGGGPVMSSPLTWASSDTRKASAFFSRRTRALPGNDVSAGRATMIQIGQPHSIQKRRFLRGTRLLWTAHFGRCRLYRMRLRSGLRHALQQLCEYSYSAQIEAARLNSKVRWLPGMDSNHDSRLQRPLSYR